MDWARGWVGGNKECVPNFAWESSWETATWQVEMEM
jgi:hypothetical protein